MGVRLGVGEGVSLSVVGWFRLGVNEGASLSVGMIETSNIQ